MYLVKLKERLHRRAVEQMDDLQYLKSLSHLGTYEDLTSIIQYITSKILITPDKLQGLLWYAYAWGLVILNTEICPLQFIQTPYGPAELNINRLYPIWDNSIIPQGPPPRLNPKIELLLNGIIKKYGPIPTDKLSRGYADHCDNIPAGEEISARDVYMYFSAGALI